MKIDTLLVPVGFNQVSKQAVNFAIQLAEKWNTKIAFVHAYLPRYAPTSGVALSSITQPTRAAAVAQHELSKEHLKDFLVEFKKLSSITYTYSVKLGSVEDVICKTASAENVDLIIMGTQGAKDVEAFFIGTVSERVSRNAPCPVLVVPKNIKSYNLDIACLALDINDEGKTTDLNILVKLLKAYKSKLRVIHVSENGDKAFKKQELLNQYDSYLNQVEHSFHVFYNDNPHVEISEFIDKNPIDCLVLVYREHGFFERLFQPGTRKKMVFKTDIPLLILK